MRQDILVICDLSDVLVKGLEGSEFAIAKKLNVPVNEVAVKLFSQDFTSLWYGENSEKEFFSGLIKDCQWSIKPEELLDIIHENFYEIEGTKSIYENLAKCYTLVLYSVNCREWVKRIKNVIEYSYIFDKEFYSFELKAHKKEADGFQRILELYPGRTYYLIDDSSSNICMAEELGIIGLHYVSAAHLRKTLQERNLL